MHRHSSMYGSQALKVPISTRTRPATSVGAGDFVRVRGHKHGSGGDKKEGALFYSETSGKFDLIPAK